MQRRLVDGRDLAIDAPGALEVGDAPAGVLDDEFADALLAPAACAQELGVLAAEYHRAGGAIEYRERAQERERIGDAAQQLLGVAIVPDLEHRACRDERHRALVWTEAALDVPRFPRMVLFVLGDAAGVFSRRTHRRPVRDTRRVAKTIEQDEAQGASDGRIGAHARSENVIRGVDAELRGDRPVDEHHDARARKSRRNMMQHELPRRERLHRGDDHRHVLGLAARHHRVDRDLFRGHRRVSRRKFSDQRVGREPRSGEHCVDERARRGDDRQAVGPAPVVAELDLSRCIGWNARFVCGQPGWPSRKSASTFSVSASARSPIASSPRFASGWGMLTKRNPGTPHSLAISPAAASKTSVMIGTAGMPSFSSVIASRRLPDEHAPQSPTPTMTKSVLP